MGVVERGYSGNKDAVRKRLRRIEGQVRRRAHPDLRDDEGTAGGPPGSAGDLGDCVAHAIEAGAPDATEKVREAAVAIERLVKS